MIEPFAFIVVFLAAYRATRFVTDDTLTDGFRQRLYAFAYYPEGTVDDGQPCGHYETRDGERVWIGDPKAAWRTYAHGLFTCPWCLGVWFSAAAYVLFRWADVMPVRAALVIVALAGAQGWFQSKEG